MVSRSEGQPSLVQLGSKQSSSFNRVVPSTVMFLATPRVARKSLIKKGEVEKIHIPVSNAEQPNITTYMCS